MRGWIPMSGDRGMCRARGETRDRAGARAAVADRQARVAAGMAPEIPEDRVAGRAVPVPEERAEQHDDVDRHCPAEEILRDSEQRVAEATQADAPGDVADEHRRSDEIVGP
jgi:hypothetical protein